MSRLNYDVTVRFAEDDLKKVRVVAAMAGMVPSVWVRAHVLRIAEDEFAKLGLRVDERELG